MKDILRIAWVRTSATTVVALATFIAMINIALTMTFYTNSHKREPKTSDIVTIRPEKFEQGSNSSAVFDSSIGKILINQEYLDALDIDQDAQFQKTCLHELRHAKNSEYGFAPINMGEISAQIAEQLHTHSDSTTISHLTHIGLDSVSVSYNVKYYIPGDALDTSDIDYIMNCAMTNWNTGKDLYAMQKFIRLIFYAKPISPFEKDFADNLTRKQMVDSVMTFNINGRPVNFYSTASEKVQKKFNQLCDEGPLRMHFGAGKKLYQK